MSIDLDALEKIALAASPGAWTNYDAKRGVKKSVWIAASASEREDVYGGPSRYGPRREVVANAVGCNGENNASFIAAVSPAIVLELVLRLKEVDRAKALIKELTTPGL